MSITIYGASDDLIEINGDISEEFSYRYQDDDDAPVPLLVASDGTVLRIRYGDGDKGIWHITPLVKGPHYQKTFEATDDAGDDYTDRVTLGGTIEWVVYGAEIAKRKPAAPGKEGDRG